MVPCWSKELSIYPLIPLRRLLLGGSLIQFPKKNRGKQVTWIFGVEISALICTILGSYPWARKPNEWSYLGGFGGAAGSATSRYDFLPRPISRLTCHRMTSVSNLLPPTALLTQEPSRWSCGSCLLRVECSNLRNSTNSFNDRQSHSTCSTLSETHEPIPRRFAWPNPWSLALGLIVSPSSIKRILSLIAGSRLGLFISCGTASIIGSVRESGTFSQRSFYNCLPRNGSGLPTTESGRNQERCNQLHLVVVPSKPDRTFVHTRAFAQGTLQKTYPHPRHVWRWCSFSRGGMCYFPNTRSLV